MRQRDIGLAESVSILRCALCVGADRALVPYVVRRWQKTAIPIYEYEGKGVYLFDGDITRIKIDAGAIVSTDDTDGAMWSDVAHAISVAAAPRSSDNRYRRLPAGGGVVYRCGGTRHRWKFMWQR